MYTSSRVAAPARFVLLLVLLAVFALAGAIPLPFHPASSILSILSLLLATGCIAAACSLSQ